jgi:hypothetical protein
MPQLDVTAALQVIDAGLGDMTDRELVSTDEVTNLLLDVRALLSDVDAVESSAVADSASATEAV